MDLDSLMRGMGPIQENMKKAEAERAQTQFDGKAGGGAVVVRLKGDLTVAKVTIAPAAAQAATGDASMLEDLVQVALNDALKQYVAKFGGSPDEQIQKMMSGSDICRTLHSIRRSSSALTDPTPQDVDCGGVVGTTEGS